MASLTEILTNPEIRPAVVTDATALIDTEVARTSGVSGIAIRSAYKLVKGMRPGMVAHAADGLLVPFSKQLDPFYQEHLETGAPLADILGSNRASMADALLMITDERAQGTRHATLKRAYQRVRPAARRYVEDAAPGVAGLISAHTPSTG